MVQFIIFLSNGYITIIKMDISGMLLAIAFVVVFIYSIFKIMVFYDMETTDSMPYVLFFVFIVISAGILPNQIYAD
jgi:hypothetical protein